LKREKGKRQNKPGQGGRGGANNVENRGVNLLTENNQTVLPARIEGIKERNTT